MSFAEKQVEYKQVTEFFCGSFHHSCYFNISWIWEKEIGHTTDIGCWYLYINYFILPLISLSKIFVMTVTSVRN